MLETCLPPQHSTYCCSQTSSSQKAHLHGRARTLGPKDLPAIQQQTGALHCAARDTCQTQCCLQLGSSGALCRFFLTQKLLLHMTVPLTQLLVLLHLLSELSKQTEGLNVSDRVAEKPPTGRTAAPNLASQVALQAAKVGDALISCQMYVALTPACNAALGSSCVA